MELRRAVSTARDETFRVFLPHALLLLFSSQYPLPNRKTQPGTATKRKGQRLSQRMTSTRGYDKARLRHCVSHFLNALDVVVRASMQAKTDIEIQYILRIGMFVFSIFFFLHVPWLYSAPTDRLRTAWRILAARKKTYRNQCTIDQDELRSNQGKNTRGCKSSR